MRLRSRRLALLGGASLAGVLAALVPLAARALGTPATPAVGPAPEIVLAPPPAMPVANGATVIGSDGSSFAIFDGSLGLHVQRVSADGTLLDPVGVPVPYALAASRGIYGAPLAVAPAANGYLLAGLHGTDVVAAHVGSDLSALDATPVKLGSIQTNANATFAMARGAGGGYLLAWNEQPFWSGNGHVTATLLDATGAPSGTPLVLAPAGSAGQLIGPAVAYANGTYELVWGQGGTLFAVRISEAGKQLDAAPATITTTAYAPPAVVAAGSHFVVAWNDDRADGGSGDFYAARIGGDGTVLDAGGTLVRAGAAFDGLAYTPATGVVAAWLDRGANKSQTSVLSESDLTLSAGSALPSSSGWLDVASNGSVVLATWGTGEATAATPLTATAAPTLNPPTTLGDLPGMNQGVHVATSGHGYLATWLVESPTTLPYRYELWARALDEAGSPTGKPFQVSSSVGSLWASPNEPAVVWTGTEYRVIWVTPGDPSDPGQDPPTGPFYVRVQQDGTLLDTAPQTLDRDLPASPSIAYAGGGGHLYAVATNQSEVTITDTSSTAAAHIWFTSSQPAVTWIDPTHLEVVFVSPDLFGSDVFGSVVDVTTMTATTPVKIAADTSDALRQPMVARGQDETLVAFTRTKDGTIAVCSLDAAGKLLDGPISTGAPANVFTPSLTWDGARYLLAWQAQGASGVTAYATDLGTDTSPFVIAGAVPPFAESVASPGPGVASMGSGAALLVGSRATASDTSVVGVTWTSRPKPPPPPGDAGVDAAPDGGGSSDDGSVDAADAGEDAPADAGQDAPHAVDAGAPRDAGGARADGGDAGSGEGAGGSGDDSGCGCRVGATRDGAAPAWGALVGLALAGARLGRRRARR